MSIFSWYTSEDLPRHPVAFVALVMTRCIVTLILFGVFVVGLGFLAGLVR